MMARRLLVLASICAGTSASADLSMKTVLYDCLRGGQISASYVGSGTDSGVILLVEGQQIALPSARTGSGARYVSDETGYVWHTKGDDAFLAWIGDGEAQETLTSCRVK